MEEKQNKGRSFSVISEIQPYGELPELTINYNAGDSQTGTAGVYEMAAYATSADMPPPGKDNIYGKENQDQGESVYFKEQKVGTGENAYCLEQRVSTDDGLQPDTPKISGSADASDKPEVRWKVNSVYGDNNKMSLPKTGDIVEYAAPDLSQKKSRRNKALSAGETMVKDQVAQSLTASVIV